MDNEQGITRERAQAVAEREIAAAAEPCKRAVSPTAVGITHPGLADAVENGALQLLVRDLTDANVKRWADVFIPMQVDGERRGEELPKGATLVASAPLYGIEHEAVEVIGRTVVVTPGGQLVVLFVDATGPSLDRKEGRS